MSATMIMTLCVPAFAIETEESQMDELLESKIAIESEIMDGEEFFEYLSCLPGTIITNEYDRYLEEKAGAEERIDRGVGTLEDRELVEFDYREYYYGLKEKSEEELAKMGYNPERIEIIKNFKGTESEIRLASADVAGTMTIVKVSKKSTNRLDIRVRYDFSVSGVFAIKKTDTILVGNVNEFVYDSDEDTATCGITYKAGGASKTYSKEVEPTIAKGTSYQTVQAPFEYTVYKPLGADSAYPYYISKGHMYVTFQNNDGKNQAIFSGEYKHLTITASVQDLIAAIIACETGAYSAGLMSITKFVLSVQESAKSYGYDEKLAKYVP